jgi:hypothetical protein
LDLIHNLLRLDINSGDQDRAGIGRDVFYHRSVVHSRGESVVEHGERGHGREDKDQAGGAIPGPFLELVDPFLKSYGHH